MAAGDQQVADMRQQALGTLVGAALRQFGKDPSFRQIRRGDGGNREQPLAHGVADILLAQRAATAGAQHRVADQRHARQPDHDLEHRLDHLNRAEHAQLDGGDGEVGDHCVGLGEYPLAVEHAEVGDVDGVLHGERGDGRRSVAGLCQQGFDVRLQAGAATGIVAGQAEDDGTGSEVFHGVRAYHQTALAGRGSCASIRHRRAHRSSAKSSGESAFSGCARRCGRLLALWFSDRATEFTDGGFAVVAWPARGIMRYVFLFFPAVLLPWPPPSSSTNTPVICRSGR